MASAKTASATAYGAWSGEAGRQCGPCDLDRWWHPTGPRRHVPRTSSSLLRPSQRHLPSQGIVPKRRANVQGGGGDDRSGPGTVIQAGLAARKRRVGAVRGAVPAQTHRKVRLSSNGCGWVEARSAGRRGVLAVHLTGGGRGTPWPGVGRSGVAAGRPACQRATRVLRCAAALRVTHRPSLRSSSRYGPCGPAWTGASRPSTTTRKARRLAVRG